jgi:DNA-binding response OmpR family regulator
MEKIMVIDSDAHQIKLLSEGLAGNYHILNCSRGSKAVELFRLYRPSAVILDPLTFDLNGRDFVRQVRVHSRRPIPILALTRITTLRHIEESFDWGVDIIFSKPCSVERIRKKLVHYLGHPAESKQLETAGV